MYEGEWEEAVCWFTSAKPESCVKEETEVAAVQSALDRLGADVQSGFDSPLFCLSPMLTFHLEWFLLLFSFKERKRHFVDNRSSTPHHNAD